MSKTKPSRALRARHFLAVGTLTVLMVCLALAFGQSAQAQEPGYDEKYDDLCGLKPHKDWARLKRRPKEARELRELSDKYPNSRLMRESHGATRKQARREIWFSRPNGDITYCLEGRRFRRTSTLAKSMGLPDECTSHAFWRFSAPDPEAKILSFGTMLCQGM